MVGFNEGAKVVVEQLSAKDWEVKEPFYYQANQDRFLVYPGMGTDFASVPRIFAWFIPTYGKYTKAAMVHDLLWREYASAGKMEWIDADAIFRQAMRLLGVPFLQRWIMWTAVRWGALFKPRGRHRWWTQMHLVLLFSLIALPIVVPPAVLILVSYLFYALIEFIVWLPLKAWQKWGGGKKRVNPPEMEFNLTQRK